MAQGLAHVGGEPPPAHRAQDLVHLAADFLRRRLGRWALPSSAGACSSSRPLPQASPDLGGQVGEDEYQGAAPGPGAFGPLSTARAMNWSRGKGMSPMGG